MGTRGNVLDWLLSCQHTKRHAFTGADPGGFGWSDLSGAVPDADDTPGALLAVAEFHQRTQGNEMDSRELDGYEWLLRLQNRNGGWPTFCRGWGRLPFDRSGTDLTAHVLRALRVWAMDLVQHDFWPLDRLRDAMRVAIGRGRAFLDRTQKSNGSWSPLWFGNQDHPQEDNPVYGTAKVLMAYRDLELMDSPEARRGVAWLVANQNVDGGWGSGAWGMQKAECRMQNESGAEPGRASGVESAGEAAPQYRVPSTKYQVLGTQHSVPNTAADAAEPPNPKSKIQSLKSSIEETALAVEALLATLPLNPEPRTLNPGNATEGVPYSAVVRGLNWLLDRVEQNHHRQPAPIGFYFAKLWYYERLYPLTFTVAALGRACLQFAHLENRVTPEAPSETRAP